MCGKHPQYPQRTETVNHPLLPKITNTRLDRFFSGPYASQNLDKLLDRARYSGSPHVKLTGWSAPDGGKPSFDEATRHFSDGSLDVKSDKPTVIEKGFVFGQSWSNHWVKVELTLPADVVQAGQRGEEIIFEFDPSCEAMVYSLSGVPQHGITGGPNTLKDGQPGEQEDRRIEHMIPAEAVKAGRYECWVEVSCNLMFGLGPYRYLHPAPDRSFPLVSADIILPNPHARALRTDFRILAEVSRHPAAQATGIAQKALKAADDIMNLFRVPAANGLSAEETDAMLRKCREIGWGVLGPLGEAEKRELSVWKKEEGREAEIWAIGHCHIDTAWLWRYTQTQQKIARSWTSQCDLMDRYPNHQFAASSAQQYHWLETLYPSAFDRVSSYVKKGRFHPVGGAWLEHDCMMPSGESLIRQYLYGQRYFRERFGSYCREAFLPDTFGYASQLPQILRSAGLNYFFTQKISWNNINVFPYNTFNWAGIDGTQVLAHMTPVDNYNGQCTFGELIKGIQNNKNLGVTDQCLFLFGNGDGGGGPTPAMMERLERLDSLGRTNPGVPTLKIGSPIDFFDNLCTKTEGGKTLPTWRGELYLELHRGTYTTQACIKKGNRDIETLLRDLEYFATLASITSLDYIYPTVEIREIWQEIMLGQFHDCLPGTTIKAVVEDNLEIYARRGTQARKLLDDAVSVLRSTTDDNGSPKSTVIDSLRLAREEVYEDQSHPGQYSWLTTDKRGMGTLSPGPSGLTAPTISKDTSTGAYTLRNARFSVTLSSSPSRIVSIVDHLHEDREIIAPGVETESAGFMLYEDYPLTYDAWDAEVYHLKMGHEIMFDTVEEVSIPGQGDGQSLRRGLVASAKFGQSSAKLFISLDATTPDTALTAVIHMRAEVDWHEEHRFLKFALPLDVHSAYATYGTQFGVIERPTHRNTTIDQAKFEVCAHGFADLSEAGFGVAIASRDKYGYAVEGNTMRLSLVRAPTSPDPDTDQGHHSIPFAIIPHVKHLAETDVHRQVMKYTNEPYILSGSFILPSFTVSGDRSAGIVLETIKRGEDDGAAGAKGKTVLLRLYEAKGGRASGTLSIQGVKVQPAEYVNILEEPLPDAGEARCDLHMTPETKGAGASAALTTEIRLTMRGFEIQTLRLHIVD